MIRFRAALLPVRLRVVTLRLIAANHAVCHACIPA